MGHDPIGIVFGSDDHVLISAAVVVTYNSALFGGRDRYSPDAADLLFLHI